eukprot:g3647.t1
MSSSGNPFASEFMGKMADGGEIRTLNAQTLDEPVTTTIMRDIKMVGTKLKYVLMPAGGGEATLRELRKWDLWGPLLLCMMLAIELSSQARADQGATVFAAVFFIVWCGAGVVTLNAQLLGGKVSFFQSVCVLGYCIFPLNISAVLCLAWSNAVWRGFVVTAGLAWSTRASLVFMSQLVPEQRRWLALYPVVLFYVVIAWMVSVH